MRKNKYFEENLIIETERKNVLEYSFNGKLKSKIYVSNILFYIFWQTEIMHLKPVIPNTHFTKVNIHNLEVEVSD